MMTWQQIRLTIVTSLCFAFCPGEPQLAYAQSSQALLEEVVVTARKREESYQDVPVVSTVLGTAQLEVFQTTDFFNLADRVPGMVVGDNVGSTGANVTIRGIGSSSFNSATDGAVSVNIDGMQFSHGDVLRSGFFDVEQVEVLKGPQALFFGKNSPGGIVALRTADPTDEFELMARLGYETEADGLVGQAVVSGPISDSFGARLALAYTDQDGYFDNIANPAPGLGGVGPAEGRISSSDSTFARLTLTYQPNDRFDARLKLNHEQRDSEGDGGSAQIVGCDFPFDPIETCELDGDFAIADLDPLLFTQPLSGEMLPNGGVPFQDTTTTFGTLQLNFALTDELVLTSLTGFSSNEHDFLINGSFQPGTVDQLTPIVGIPGSTTTAASNNHEQDFFTQELRLTSDFADSSVNYMFGVFFEDGSQEFNRDVRIPLFGLYFDDLQEIDIETTAVFGQLLWDVSDTIEVGIGARYTNEERTLETRDDGVTFTAVGPFFGPGVVTNAVSEVDVDNFSPEVTLTWRPSDTLTIFGAYKEGFKSGSFNVDQPTPLDRSYGAESADGFEIGLKSLLLDGSLRLNASIYFYDYDDLQVSRTVNLPGGGGTLLQVVNAATASAKGFEADFVYGASSIEGLSLFGSLNYNKGEFDRFADAACYGGQLISDGCDLNFSTGANQVAPGVNLGGFTAQDLSGRELPRSPELTGNFGFNLTRQLSAAGLMFSLTAGVSYTDDMVLDTSYNPRTFQDSFTKTNANLTIFPDNERWELAIIGNNLGDEVVASTCFSGPFDQGGGLVPNPSGLPINPIIPNSFDQGLCFPQPGREIWIRFTIRNQ